MKTNKAFKKRIRVTKKGKLLVRKSGVNHFNSKESRRKQLKRKTMVEITMSNKAKSRFLPNK